MNGQIFPWQQSWVGWKILQKRSGNPLLPLSKCVRLSVLPEGLILAIRRHLFCRRRPHIKVGDCFLDLCSHDVRGCMRWTDLVKCCLALISLNDLASAARMRSCGCGNPCRKSLLGPPRSLKWPRTLFLVIPRHLASNIGVSNAANYWPGGPNTSLRWTSRLFQPGQKITWGGRLKQTVLSICRESWDGKWQGDRGANKAIFWILQILLSCDTSHLLLGL